MNDFDALLAELAPLQKAMEKPMGDAKVTAAADEADAVLPDGEGEGEGEGEGKPAVMAKSDDVDDDDMLGKSFSVTMPDGSVQEAFDGTAMMKAMGTQLVAIKQHATDRDLELATAKGELAKALSACSALLGIVKPMAEMTKAMRAELTAIGGAGRGRQATVSLVDKPALSAAPAAPAAPNTNEIMAKAMTLVDAGDFSSAEIARLEAHLGRGNPVPADLAARLR